MLVFFGGGRAGIVIVHCLGNTSFHIPRNFFFLRLLRPESEAGVRTLDLLVFVYHLSQALP